MTWHHHRIWIVAVLLASGLALAWLIAKTPVPPQVEDPRGIATTTPDLTGRAIYTNGEYGFVISYPETAQITESFVPGYRLPIWWRATADPESKGTLLLQIMSYSTQSDHSYPRYFDALVRVGVSDHPQEVAACERLTPDRAETALADATFGGATWKVFSFGDAGMQQHVKGVSYRTVHEGTCYAVEKIAVGSNYREDPASADDVPDALLDERYQGLDQIVESFTFAR